MPRMLRLLLVEDDPNDEALLLRTLRRAGYEPRHRRVETAMEMALALEEEWDIVICDDYLPRFSGRAAWEQLQQALPEVPFILLSGKSLFLSQEPTPGAPGDFVPKGADARLLEVLAEKLASPRAR